MPPVGIAVEKENTSLPKKKISREKIIKVMTIKEVAVPSTSCHRRELKVL